MCHTRLPGGYNHRANEMNHRVRVRSISRSVSMVFDERGLVLFAPSRQSPVADNDGDFVVASLGERLARVSGRKRTRGGE